MSRTHINKAGIIHPLRYQTIDKTIEIKKAKIYRATKLTTNSAAIVGAGKSKNTPAANEKTAQKIKICLALTKNG